MSQHNNTGNRGFLSDEQTEDGLYPIYGVAIGSNDITIGNKSGEPKLWRPDVLEEAADTLQGKDIVVNHENQNAFLKIGEIEEAKFEDGRGVVYRGVIDDDELAGKIDRDWLEVSPRIRHSKAHEELQGVKVPEYIQEFDNLSVVRRGAAKSNEVHLGEVEELSVEELQESFEDDDNSVIEYQNVTDSEEAEELQEEMDFARWMYEDQNGATGASEKFGCSGSHAHQINGKTWYMPCQTHDEFLKKFKENRDSEMSLSEGSYVSWDDGVGRVVEFGDSCEVQPYEESEGGWCPANSTIEKEMDELSEDVPDEVVEQVEVSDEESIEDEFAEDVVENRAREEMRMASQLASHSELTKSESLSVIDAFNPTRETDYSQFAQMIYKVMEEAEMEKLYSEMEKHMEEASASDSGSEGGSSPLNKILL